MLYKTEESVIPLKSGIQLRCVYGAKESYATQTRGAEYQLKPATRYDTGRYDEIG